MRFLVALLLALSFSGGMARAQQDTLEPSSAEDVAIAFFHTGGVHPDYTKWAKGGKEYKIAAPARADEVLDREKQRLMKLYRGYDPDEDLLRVRAEALVSLHAAKGSDGEDAYSMTMAFRGGDITYFPFKFQDYDIAIVPQGLEKLMRQPLTREQFELMFEAFKQKPDGDASLYLDMKPAKSYIQQPYPLDGKDQWMMLADPVSLNLRGTDGALLWSHASDWYVSPQTKAVRGLYKQ